MVNKKIILLLALMMVLLAGTVFSETEIWCHNPRNLGPSPCVVLYGSDWDHATCPGNYYCVSNQVCYPAGYVYNSGSYGDRVVCSSTYNTWWVECDYDSDCSSGKECSAGECVTPSADPETPTVIVSCNADEPSQFTCLPDDGYTTLDCYQETGSSDQGQCMFNNNCYSDGVGGQVHTIRSSGNDKLAMCIYNWWYDLDQYQEDCEQGGKSWVTFGESTGEASSGQTECCGDDSNENVVSANGYTRCCSSSSDSVDTSGNCIVPDTTPPVETGFSITSSSPSTSSRVYFRSSGTDNVGVDHYDLNYKYRASSTDSWTSYRADVMQPSASGGTSDTTTYSYVVTEGAGYYYFDAHVHDAAGNTLFDSPGTANNAVGGIEMCYDNLKPNAPSLSISVGSNDVVTATFSQNGDNGCAGIKSSDKYRILWYSSTGCSGYFAQAYTDSTSQTQDFSSYGEGSYSARVYVYDNAGNYERKCVDFEITGPPDMTCSLSISKSSFNIGEDPTVSATFSNIGAGPTPVSVNNLVILYRGSTYISGGTAIGGIYAAGHSTPYSNTVSGLWGSLSAGSYTIKAVVDEFDTADESNENNNLCTVNIEIDGCYTDADCDDGYYCDDYFTCAREYADCTVSGYSTCPSFSASCIDTSTNPDRACCSASYVGYDYPTWSTIVDEGSTYDVCGTSVDCYEDSHCSSGSTDNDGGLNYQTASSCVDYVGVCSGGSCVSPSTYSDYCSGTTLYEAQDTGSSCGYQTKNCNDYDDDQCTNTCNTATGDIEERCNDWTCSGNRCVDSGSDWWDDNIYNCVDTASDSDNGDYFTQGTCTDKDACSSGQTTCPTYTDDDTCKDSATLYEYSVSGNDCVRNEVVCQDQCGSGEVSVCSNGACTECVSASDHCSSSSSHTEDDDGSGRYRHYFTTSWNVQDCGLDTCSGDSDGNNPQQVGGTIYIGRSCSNGACLSDYTRSDYCIDSVNLREYFCNGDVLDGDYYDCDSYCQGRGYDSGSCTGNRCLCSNDCALSNVQITNSCSGSVCNAGDIITMTGTLSGTCPTITHFQIDASGDSCSIYAGSAQIDGISDSSITQTSNSVSGSWTIPSIPSECEYKEITAGDSAIRENGDVDTGTLIGNAVSASGSFYLVGVPSSTTSSTTSTTSTTTSSSTTSTSAVTTTTTPATTSTAEATTTTSAVTTSTACSDTCSSLGYECGTQSVCGVSTDCGSCGSGEICNSGGLCEVGDCVLETKYRASEAISEEKHRRIYRRYYARLDETCDDIEARQCDAFDPACTLCIARVAKGDSLEDCENSCGGSLPFYCTDTVNDVYIKSSTCESINMYCAMEKGIITDKDSENLCVYSDTCKQCVRALGTGLLLNPYVRLNCETACRYNFPSIGGVLPEKLSPVTDTEIIPLVVPSRFCVNLIKDSAYFDYGLGSASDDCLVYKREGRVRSVQPLSTLQDFLDAMEVSEGEFKVMDDDQTDTAECCPDQCVFNGMCYDSGDTMTINDVEVKCYDRDGSAPSTPSTPSAGSWWDTDYAKCKDITITNVPGTELSDFPVYVKLDYDSDMNTDFSDIRFVDSECGNDGNELSYEIESYTDSTDANVWVKVPTLSASGKTISVYYGNAAAASGENPSSVWDSNYGVVWHFAGSGNIMDSTSNNVDSAMPASWEYSSASEMIDGTLFMTAQPRGDGDYVSTNVNNLADWTIEFWYYARDKPSSDATTDAFVVHTYRWNGLTVGSFGNPPADKIDYTSFNGIRTGDQTDFGDGTWDHFMLTQDRDGGSSGSEVKLVLYKNGIETSTFYSAEDSTSTTIKLGTEGDLYQIGGFVDEFRVSKNVRSSEWVRQTYEVMENQASVISFGSEESQ